MKEGDIVDGVFIFNHTLKLMKEFHEVVRKPGHNFPNLEKLISGIGDETKFPVHLAYGVHVGLFEDVTDLCEPPTDKQTAMLTDKGKTFYSKWLLTQE